MASTAVQSQIYRSLPETERAEAVAERILKGIALGLLKVGERLPSEAALSDMFGVGLLTLREALAGLREQGIVETRRGRSGGTFVVKQPPPQTDVIREWFLSTSVSEIRDIGDEHFAISAATVRLACERAVQHDFDRLQDLAEALVLAATPEERVPADARFHFDRDNPGSRTRPTTTHRVDYNDEPHSSAALAGKSGPDNVHRHSRRDHRHQYHHPHPRHCSCPGTTLPFS